MYRKGKLSYSKDVNMQIERVPCALGKYLTQILRHIWVKMLGFKIFTGYLESGKFRLAQISISKEYFTG